jgi:hypothetical protein
MDSEARSRIYSIEEVVGFLLYIREAPLIVNFATSLENTPLNSCRVIIFMLWMVDWSAQVE